jgi:hypothetical protein
MKHLLTLLMLATGATVLSQATAAAEDAAHPNSGCADDPQPQRRRPGEPEPERLQPVPCDVHRLRLPATDQLVSPVPYDRWKVVQAAGVPGRLIDPYGGNNPLKGDRPLAGDGYMNLTVTSNSLIEIRHVPLVAAAGTASLRGVNQLFTSESVTVDTFAYKGDTVFKPPDLQVRFTPVFNVTNTRTGGGQTQVSTSTVGAQALFVEAHLHNASAHYDFDSIRAGVQGMISDFRGFVLSDQPVGVRLFGTRDNDFYQYSLGWFRTLPKNANRQNEIGRGLAPNDIVMGNLIVQDLGVPGLNSEFTLIYDRNRAVGTGVLAPESTGQLAAAAFVDNVRHDFDVGYLGYSADGHLGKLNLTLSVYEALGQEKETVFGGQDSSVQASFAAAELSRDFDWVRVRGSVLYASGDAHPFSDTSRGFDGISESALFAGADSSFFLHQQLKLIPDQLDLKERDSLYPDLRGAAQNGQPNYKNPGMRLVGLGTDLDLIPQLRVSVDVNHIWLDQPQTLDAVLGVAGISRDIGTELALDVIWRPLDSQNIIVRLSGAQLFAAQGGRKLAGGSNPFSAFASLILTY